MDIDIHRCASTFHTKALMVASLALYAELFLLNMCICACLQIAGDEASHHRIDWSVQGLQQVLDVVDNHRWVHFDATIGTQPGLRYLTCNLVFEISRIPLCRKPYRKHSVLNQDNEITSFPRLRGQSTKSDRRNSS